MVCDFRTYGFEIHIHVPGNRHICVTPCVGKCERGLVVSTLGRYKPATYSHYQYKAQTQVTYLMLIQIISNINLGIRAYLESGGFLLYLCACCLSVRLDRKLIQRTSQHCAQVGRNPQVPNYRSMRFQVVMMSWFGLCRNQVTSDPLERMTALVPGQVA
jgi:hypothetical protein